MAKLKYVQVESSLESNYITLCDVYFYNVSEDNTEKEKQQTEGTIQTITSLIFHAINIEGTSIREMDNVTYEKNYKRFYHDLTTAIKECAKNEVDFNDFVEIIDEIVGAAHTLATAFAKLDLIKAEILESEVEEGESGEDQDLDEGKE